jgi:hypothetical protein
MKRGLLASRGCGMGIPSLHSGEALPAPSPTCASGWICLSCCDVMTCFVRERDIPATAGIPWLRSGEALPAPSWTSASGWICLSCCDVMTCFVRERDAPATAGEPPALQGNHLADREPPTLHLDLVGAHHLLGDGA